MNEYVHMSLPHLSSFFDVRPHLVAPRPSQPRRRRAPATRATSKQASKRASERIVFGTRLRTFWIATSFLPRLNAWLLPFTRRSRCLFAAASLPAPQYKRCNAIGLHLHFPLIAHCTGFWTSPALLLLLRICLPTCQTYRRSLPFLVWLISQRKTACSETRGNHSPVARTPLLNPHEPRTTMTRP